MQWVIALCLVTSGFPFDFHSASWEKLNPGENFKDVSLGSAGVFVLALNGSSFYREGTREDNNARGTGWVAMGGNFSQIDVGSKVVWAVDINNNVYMRKVWRYRPDGRVWKTVEGSLIQVSVSDNGHVWGIEPGNSIVRRLGASKRNKQGDEWQSIDGNAYSISVGYYGVWGVGSFGHSIYREGTYGDKDTTGTAWMSTTGEMQSISSGPDGVYAIDYLNGIYRRDGISQETQAGDRWDYTGRDGTIFVPNQDATWLLFGRSLYYGSPGNITMGV